MEALLTDISAGKYKLIVVLAGAGVSTAAGIPDFRTPGTGLYSNLQRFDLPFPEAVFDLEYLRERPEAFFLLASEMYPTQFEPTAFHRFVAWLARLGYLKRVYTQNIDTLERRAGVPAELIVEAHGSFSANHCIDCHEEADKDEVERTIVVEKEVPRCKVCDGIVKPDIVFFGEALPERFHELMATDFDDVDLAIVAGTSLQVSPFNQLPMLVPKGVPRYLLNRDKVGNLGSRKADVLVLEDMDRHDVLFAKYVTSEGDEVVEAVEVVEAEVEAPAEPAVVVGAADEVPLATVSASSAKAPEAKAEAKAETKAGADQTDTPRLPEDVDDDLGDETAETVESVETVAEEDVRTGFLAGLLRRLRVG